MTANITLHPPGPGEGRRLIRTATVVVKGCHYRANDWSGKKPLHAYCKDGKLQWAETGFGQPTIKETTCPRCHGTGYRDVEVRVDGLVDKYTSVRIIDGQIVTRTYWYWITNQEWEDWMCADSENELLYTILQRYAAGEDVPGVTEVRDG